jgi:hypothetical protein
MMSERPAPWQVPAPPEPEEVLAREIIRHLKGLTVAFERWLEARKMKSMGKM